MRLLSRLAHFAEHRIQGRDFAVLACDGFLRLAPDLCILGTAKRDLRHRDRTAVMLDHLANPRLAGIGSLRRHHLLVHVHLGRAVGVGRGWLHHLGMIHALMVHALMPRLLG